MLMNSPAICRIIYKSFLIASVLAFAGCTRKYSANISQTSFYYWRSTFSLSGNEKMMIDSLAVKKLYIKFFDVDWNPFNKSPQPVGIIKFNSDIPDSMRIVPTVFITNRTFLSLQNTEIALLAQRIIRKIFSLIPQRDQTKVDEIQVDCDWTPGTRIKYFQFLDSMGRSCHERNIALSATIRLHQYAEPNITGVPPVKQGVLMFYNMGRIEGRNAVNSILDLDIGKQYLNRNHYYPVHLNIALPVFCWGVLMRGDRVINLLHDISRDELEDTTFFQYAGQNLYRAKKGHYCCGEYLYPDDLIRFESVSQAGLNEAALLLKNNFRNKSFELIFFHLEPKLESRYGSAYFRMLINSFNN